MEYAGKNVELLPPKVKEWVVAMANWCKPDSVRVIIGTEEEKNEIYTMLEKDGVIKRLPKYENCWLARTNPQDVARVEAKTVIASEQEHDTVTITKLGYHVPGALGPWMSTQELDKALAERFPGCMRGRVMYVVPFSMGPVGSVFSKIGIEVTDSAYVVINMLIMARVNTEVLKTIHGDEFVRCLHSVGQPLPSDRPIISNWPCNPEKTIIAHIPAQKKIASFGSGYGGNSLLGKKCLALRIGSTLGRREGWLAEHMLIMGITNPKGVKRYVCAAFPSQCGKTNMAMMTSTLPGYKIEVVGDDIAWLRLDDKGQLRAVNPESGFFGVAPGTSKKTNPIAMQTIFKNTIFTNVAETSDGGVWWEDIGEEIGKGVTVTDWQGNPWTPEKGTPAAQANSRFTTPAGQCPIIDPAWESPEGVPISAIVFGGRRPEGVPLVYEAYNWAHGVFIGASVKSEATAAAEFKGKVVMHDPMAMRPFLSYNFGYYLAHWLEMQDLAKGHPMPRVFHVNWFRKSPEGKFLWPGFGENIRVLDWMLRRIDGEDIAVPSPIGLLPKHDSINLDGLGKIDLDALFDIKRDFWMKEIDELEAFFKQEVGADLPPAVQKEMDDVDRRIKEMKQ